MTAAETSDGGLPMKPKYAKPIPRKDEYEHSREEIDFMVAMQAEKERLGRALTPREILHVAHRLGYRRVIDVAELKEKGIATTTKRKR